MHRILPWRRFLPLLLILFNQYHAFQPLSFCSNRRNIAVYVTNSNKDKTITARIGQEDEFLEDASLSSPSFVLDPLVQQGLLRLQQQEDDDDDDDENEHDKEDDEFSRTTAAEVRTYLHANTGLAVWRRCLLRGRLPVENQDFDHGNIWPPAPLYGPVCAAMAALNLPRLVLRHGNAVVNAVLITFLRLVVQFQQAKQHGRAVASIENDDDNEEEWDDYWEEDDDNDDDDDDEEEETKEDYYEPFSEQELQTLAEELVASQLVDEWGGVVGGVTALDQLFGVQNNDLFLNEGFGLQDGVWQHSGWKTLNQIQQDQLANMPQLKQLLNQIGRRPTIEQSNAVHRFVPRQLDSDGALGAQLDVQRRESVSGLTQSGSLTEMLPSEAVLLKGSSVALRRLFMAKRVESKLLSYQMSGWYDTESIPRPETRRLHNMPSAPGGPIIVCLDTSWSMSGQRETLSKAVVVACVTAAHQQKRDCQVVAFSTASGVMETGLLTADAAGVERLLDFLSHSFGGGTDVTGALKHAVRTLGAQNQMAAADLLLVTDGEIPDPPVSADILEDLDRLKRRTGMQIHGLLVGKRESIPLTKLCTTTHDFLVGYDPLAMVSQEAKRGPAVGRLQAQLIYASQRTAYSTTSSQLWKWPKSSSQTKWQTMGTCSFDCRLALRATNRNSEESVLLRRKREDRKRKGRFDDDDDYLWDSNSEGQSVDGSDISVVVSSAAESYTAKLDEALSSLRANVSMALKRDSRISDNVDTEQNADSSCWKYKAELESAIQRVGENLVEREEEARLVVLGLVSGEHVLLLGIPGTGKSALAGRLSRLCGGFFFQRLLTRFTTPEEIFGPLSLRALENDEYKRCTDGFLPTASVAFLDEVFKANSAILNTLLTILNERQFDNGAGQREDCAIRCVVGASNEMPESDELDALYDRFLIRKEVLSVSDEGIMRILQMPTPGSSPCDPSNGTARDDEEACDLVFSQGLERVVKELSVAAERVLMTEDTCILIRDLRNFMKDDIGVDVSDRRLVKAARLLKICAASNGRTRVDPLDCLLLQHIVWRLPDQREAVREWLWRHVSPEGSSASGSIAQFRLLLENLRNEAVQVVRKTSGDVSGSMGAIRGDILVIDSLLNEISGIVAILQERSVSLERHIQVLRRSTSHLWLSPDESQAAQQVLLPKAESYLSEIQQLLTDAKSLELSLKEGSFIENDMRLSVIEMLWEEGGGMEITFSDEELDMGMKEAKVKYDLETFRKWKRAKKKASK